MLDNLIKEKKKEESKQKTLVYELVYEGNTSSMWVLSMLINKLVKAAKGIQSMAHL